MKFAIVGAGNIAQLRRAAIEELPGCALIGAYDIAPERAAAMAGDGTAFTSLEALMDAPSVDTVIICTPPDTHEEIATAALAAGKHVIVEKPMANSQAACARMIKAARKADRVLTVGFNHRYFPAIKDVHRAVTSGMIGTLSHVRGYTGHTGLSEFGAEWMYAKDVMGGGALMDNGIHMIDLVHHMMGPVEGVCGKATTTIWNLDRSEDNAYALLSGKDGVVGTLGASWSEWKGYHFYIEAYGTQGMARAYYAPMRSTIITMKRPGAAPVKKNNFYLPLIFREKFKGWQSTAIQTFVEEMTDFQALVAGRTPAGPVARAEDGFRAIEIANAVYSSSDSGKTVKLKKDI